MRLLKQKVSEIFSEQPIPREFSTALKSQNTKNTNVAETPFQRVLVDGSFNNPNYWMRYALVTSALNLKPHNQIGLVGQYHRKTIRNLFEYLEFNKIISYSITLKIVFRALFLTSKIYKQIRRKSDVMTITLPDNFPNSWFYDNILKEQRLSSISTNNLNFFITVFRGISKLLFIKQMFQNNEIDLCIASQDAGFFGSSLVFQALKSKIPVILATGHSGLNRFRYFKTIGDWKYQGSDLPSARVLVPMPETKRHQLRELGIEYLSRRKRLETSEFAVQTVRRITTQKNNSSLKNWLAMNGKDANKPTIVIYAPNWFDFPHFCGMKNFLDYEDFIHSILKCCRKRHDINWIFKPHPCDFWYGGPTLANIIGNHLPPNCDLLSYDFNNNSILHEATGIITPHGTIGIEASNEGVAVLLAGDGWYSDWDIGLRPSSRANFEALLATDWWDLCDPQSSIENSQIFSGLMFSPEILTDPLILGEDTDQSKLIPSLIKILDQQPVELTSEISQIRSWINSGETGFHSYRLKRFLERETRTQTN